MLGNGAFLSSLLIAAWLACVVDKNYKKGAIFALVLAASAFIGLIHNGRIEWLPTNGVILGLGYVAIAALTYEKYLLVRKKEVEYA